MTARKAWLIGVAVVVITLLSFGWFLLMRPPYRFLAGAERNGFYMDPPITRENFRIDQPLLEVAKEAEAEMAISLHSSKSGTGEIIFMQGYIGGEYVCLSAMGANSVIIVIERDTVPLDSLRDWLFRNSP
jgi:hypothetical protein